MACSALPTLSSEFYDTGTAMWRDDFTSKQCKLRNLGTLEDDFTTCDYVRSLLHLHRNIF